MVWNVMVVICLLGKEVISVWNFFVCLLLCHCFSAWISLIYGHSLITISTSHPIHTPTHTHPYRKIICSPSIEIAARLCFSVCICCCMVYHHLKSCRHTRTQTHGKNVPIDFSSITLIHNIRTTYEMSKISNEHGNIYWFSHLHGIPMNL